MPTILDWLSLLAYAVVLGLVSREAWRLVGSNREVRLGKDLSGAPKAVAILGTTAGVGLIALDILVLRRAGQGVFMLGLAMMTGVALLLVRQAR